MELELILKMPPGKLPFIGILFKDRYGEYKASQTNEHWVNNFKQEKYQLLLVPGQKWMNIHLFSKDLHCDCLYENVKYNPETLKRFLHLNKGNTYNFSHIVPDEKGHKVVRTAAKKELFVLKIEKVKGPDELEF